MKITGLEVWGNALSHLCEGAHVPPIAFTSRAAHKNHSAKQNEKQTVTRATVMNDEEFKH